MNLINDKECFWINNLNRRTRYSKIKKDFSCEWLVVGAGYTGLSALEISSITPEKEIILVDAQLAGEGASSRNFGYLVETTLNDGFTSTKS